MVYKNMAHNIPIQKDTIDYRLISKAQYVMAFNMTGLGLTLSPMALGPISPVSLKCHMLKKSFIGIKAILYVSIPLQVHAV
jgi:hypothetical protein